jgi:hypothetical protein
MGNVAKWENGKKRTEVNKFFCGVWNDFQRN